jgi:hypothetical protein
VGLVLAALGRACRRGTPLVDRVLAAGIALNLFLYVSTKASTRGAHEIAIVLPYAAALSGRMLAGCRPLAGRRAAGHRARSRHGRRSATGTSIPAVAGVLLLSVYLAGLGYELTFPAAPPEGTPLASWLLEHGFRSGLAGYWQSSSVTVDTGDQVRVRAVTDSLGPYLWMADTAWYDPAVSTADFVVISEPSRRQLALLRERFGEPAKAYQVAGYTVLSWHRNLLRGWPASPGPSRVPG